ncbi:hypothetical protein L195_g056996, partial [Trifolium pratense]
AAGTAAGIAPTRWLTAATDESSSERMNRPREKEKKREFYEFFRV